MQFDLSALALAAIALLSFGLSYIGSSVGLVLGQLRLPALVYYLGSPVAGAATSLAVSAVSAFVGAIGHARAGRVRLRLVMTIGIPSAAAAFVSALWVTELEPSLVRAAIGAALVVSGIAIWIRARTERPTDDEDAADAKPHVATEVAVGTVLGGLAGGVGLLLGTLRLPVLLRLGVRPTSAVGTNMAVGCLTGAFAAVATMLEGNIDPVAFGVVAPATVLGSYFGAHATGRMTKGNLQLLIAVVLVSIGLWMVAEGVGFG